MNEINTTFVALDDLIADLLQMIIDQYEVLYGYSNTLFFYLCVLEVLFFSIQMMLGKNQNMADIIMKFFTIGVLFWIFMNLEYLSNVLVRSFSNLSMLMTGSSSEITTPSEIFIKGNEFIDSLQQNFQDKRDSYGLIDMVIPDKETFGTALGFMVIRVLFWCIFIVLILQLAIAQIEYKIVIYFSIILFPWVVFSPTKFLGEKVIPTIVGQCLKLALTYFTVALTMTVISKIAIPESGQLSFPLLIQILIQCLIVLFLSVQVQALATSFLSGMPALTAGSFMQNMTGIASMARAGSRLTSNTATTAVNTAKGNNAAGKALKNMGGLAKSGFSRLNNHMKSNTPGGQSAASAGAAGGKGNSKAAPKGDSFKRKS